MTTALANVQYKPTEITTERLGQIMVKSGFFKDLRDEAQAIVKILYGRELGFGPMASVLGVYIVDGRPSLSAQLIAAAIQGHPAYRYRVREWTATKCRIEFYEGADSLGESSFSIEEAQAAGLTGKGVWKQYPKAMLWARAMSQGARAYTAEIFSGAIYTPDELGAQVDSEGRVIDVTTGEVMADRPSEPAYVPTREQDAAATTDATTMEEALGSWTDVCREADRLSIAHKTLPDPLPRNTTIAQVEKWTVALLDRINEANASSDSDAPV